MAFALKLKLPAPPLQTGKPTDRFAVVGWANREISDALRKLDRINDDPPILSRTELALLKLSPVELCYRRTLKPLQSTGPEVFGFSADQIALEVLGGPCKDATRPLLRALDFASAVRMRRSEGREVIEALSPNWHHSPFSTNAIFQAVIAQLKISPACLQPLVSELVRIEPERMGGRELALRIVLNSPVELLAGKVARDSMDGFVSLLQTPQVPALHCRLCQLIEAIQPPRELSLWRAVLALTQSPNAEVKAAAENALFVLN